MAPESAILVGNTGSMNTSAPIIGRLNEKTLHRQLKERYRTKNSLVEEAVSGYVVDVVRPTELVEIQTRGFAGMKKKLAALLEEHTVRLVHPVAKETLITIYNRTGTSIKSSRRSPKRGNLPFAAAELLYLAELLPHPRLTVELLLIRQEEFRRDDGRGSWRRRGISITDRRLLGVEEKYVFQNPEEYLILLPEDLPTPFGHREIADRFRGTNLRGRLRLASQLTYLLRKLGLLKIVGKEGNRHLFEVIPPLKGTSKF